ncbi:hypothetical protein LCGC14_1903470 [marine sediment metagenome]|uniref:Uncharacterized protein n=1 Tax=marine sediment metagenome TaxID=412755 RepID=A0A0F9ITX8_9ZZZZ
MAETDFRLNLDVGGKRFENAALGLRFLAARSESAILDLTPIARREMIDILDTVVDAMRQRHSTRWRWGRRMPEGETQGKLQKRSGAGLAVLRPKIKQGNEEVAGTIVVPFPLSVHETGATIRSRVKLLAIPLQAALDSRGMPKKRGPRAWRNTFVARSKKGNLLIFQKKDGKIIPLYVLKKQVKIPKRLGMGVTMDKAAPIYIERVFDKAVRHLQKVM